MARFSGKVGYGIATEVSQGVWRDVITEYVYFGDVKREAIRSENDGVVNPNLISTNTISIVADAFANANFHAIRYVEWSGARWIVSSVEVQSPRLLLRLGGVYNGPTP